MISGLVSPKRIGLMNRGDVNQLLKKSKLIFRTEDSRHCLKTGDSGLKVENWHPFYIKCFITIIS